MCWHCCCDAAQIPEELWLISGAPPAKTASVLLKDNLSKNPHNSPPTGGSVRFSPCSGNLGVHANCKICISRTLLFVRPLPLFLPTVLYLVLQRQSPFLVQTGDSRVTFVQGRAVRRAVGWKQNIWHSAGVQAQSAIFVRVALLSTLFCCMNLCTVFLICVYTIYLLWLFSGISFFQSFQCFPLIPRWLRQTRSPNLVINPGFLPPLTPHLSPLDRLIGMTWGFTRAIRR